MVALWVLTAAPSPVPRRLKRSGKMPIPHRLFLPCLVLVVASCASLPTTTRGTLAETVPARVESFTPEALAEKLNTYPEGRWIVAEAGVLKCGVDVYKYEYFTVDGRGQETTASAALMIPTGSGAECSGPRPVVAGLHGTVTDRNYNLADFSGTNQASPRAMAFAGTFASEGYIVVAPNYAGFDTSPLEYHPYLNLDQQSKDVIDALAAARLVLAELDVPASEKLFLTGFSQGGTVTMATHRALQQAGMPATASVAGSGAFPIIAIADDIFRGGVLQGSTLYFPLSTRSYQEAYGDIYERPEDLFNPMYAAGVASALPTRETFPKLVADKVLPASAVFEELSPEDLQGLSPQLQEILKSGSPPQDPPSLAATYAQGFGPDALFTNAYRLAYLEDALQNPDGAAPVFTDGEPPKQAGSSLRRAYIRNDLRGWTPSTPFVMCSGQDDPAVPYRLSTAVMLRYWTEGRTAAPPGLVSAIDFETPATPDDPLTDLRKKFAAERDQIIAAQGKEAMIAGYHTQMLPKYCYMAARRYFDTLK